MLARLTGASEQAAQNWLSGVRGPSCVHLILLAQRFAAVCSTITLLAANDARQSIAIDAVEQMLYEESRCWNTGSTLKVETMTTPQPEKNAEPNTPPRFITLSKTINAIARKCILPDQLTSDIEAYVSSHRPDRNSGNPGDDLINIKLNFLESLLKDTGRQWRATATLHFSLLEAGEKAPEWRNWLATGMATRLDQADRHRAITIVEHIARDEEGFLLAHLERRLEPTLKDPTGMPALFAPEDERWKKHLGFARNELIDFMDREGIEHDLVRLPDDSSNSTKAEHETASASSAFPKSIAIVTAAGVQSVQVAGMSTQDLAAAFADTDGCKRNTGRDFVDWEAYLQGGMKLPGWAKKRPVRLQAGARGTGNSACWHPLEFAKAAVINFKRVKRLKLTRHDFFLAIDERFREVELLKHWHKDWDQWADDVYRLMREDEREQSRNPASKPGRKGR